MTQGFASSCSRLVRRLGLLALLWILWSTPGLGAPTVGFLETWSGTSINGWGGSIAIVFSNPGTGGVGGGGDGFLSMAESARGHFGVRSTGLEYVGNWTAAGITQVGVWLNDINTDEPLEIHFSVGNFSNLWQYDVGFLPPLGQWAQFSVDLTDPTKFTHTIAIDGLGYGAALQNVQVVHLRHDLPPFMQLPDSIAADLGIDNLLLTNEVVGAPLVEPGAAGRPVELAPPYPNPSRGPVALSLTGSEPGPVRIQIVDTQGRSVRHALLPEGAAGPRLWVWDGRDDRGRRVPAGVYRARAVGPRGGTTRTLVRLD